MTERRSLLGTLDRLFAGPPQSVLTLDAFLAGLEDRSYAFIIAALALPNCFPTGLPFLSTVTGIPMCLLVLQYFLGKPSPSLPRMIGQRGIRRRKLQASLVRGRPHIERLERAIHPRWNGWLSGLPRRALLAVWAAMIVLLALPIPFDNLLPAWSVMFFCLALIEGDGAMAALGWLFALLSAIWTGFLLIVGQAVVIQVLKSLF